uniref:DUF2817 domain-containing protein n=1 Tax=Chromera velia CCMP2878 TaxID=1169474 RepID=A0A0G4I7T8_9ALVE|eukprot:Cvel_11670.t1-p1 / transcript=Cvel_11670.t1 / gene=Cvel_11670 / organism=Chromera_velia_CCMP2878 / gene_product=hypothetical protein / transcript_product=hypothetical protein / location=Cvel_scaffold740:3062-4589(+) / protein_length=472 / sequence_SO=supercontig / SO=protein_coding / is_pseudo=false
MTFQVGKMRAGAFLAACVLASLATNVLCLRFKKMRLREGSIQLDENCFSTTYKEGRSKFLDAFAQAQSALSESGLHLHITSVPLGTVSTGPNDETLFTDFVTLSKVAPESDGKLSGVENLLIHSSGVHGVEGYAGNGIQVCILRALASGSLTLSPSLTDAVLFVHVVNPYGMAYYRRWNENNVDLNRNHMLTPGAHQAQPVNQAYLKIHNMLMDPKRVLQERNQNHTQGLVGVQEAQPLRRFPDDQASPCGCGVKKVVHIDVHTGLGPKGFDSLLSLESGKKSLSEETQGAAAIFDSSHIAPQTSVAYATFGSSQQGIREFFPEPVEVVSICEEFGTIGSIAIVNKLRQENVYWQGFRKTHAVPEEFQSQRSKETEPRISDASKKEVLDAFFMADDPKWLSSVAYRGLRVFVQGAIAMGVAPEGTITEVGGTSPDYCGGKWVGEGGACPVDMSSNTKPEERDPDDELFNFYD